MKLAIIAPMEEEAAAFKPRLANLRRTGDGEVPIYVGELNGSETILLQCGIGKANAAWTTALLIERYRPDGILHYGVAGGLNPELRVGDTVVATELVYSDVDATAFGYAYGQVPQMPASYPADERLLGIARRAVAEAPLEGAIVSGLVTTADSFVNRPSLAASIRSRFPSAQATDMEGAAVAQTAYRLGVPCLVVRSLSDLAGEDAKTTYQSNVDLASERAAAAAGAIALAWRRAEAG